jgi:putative oxidoreductase
MFGWTISKTNRRATLGDVGLLALRLTVGGLLAGHGAQKLFGAFGGHGVKGTAQWLESLGLQPGHVWSVLAGLSEFGGGLLIATGLFAPLGTLGVMGSMGMASGTAHRGKPIWVTSGGAELPVTNIAVATALMLTGPGALSLDRAFGISLPRWIALPGLAAVGATVAYGAVASKRTADAEKRIAGAQLTMEDSARLA